MMTQSNIEKSNKLLFFLLSWKVKSTSRISLLSYVLGQGMRELLSQNYISISILTMQPKILLLILKSSKID